MIKLDHLAINGEIRRLIFVRMAGTDLQHDLQHELQHDLKKLKNHRLFEPSILSIIGATDRRDACKARVFSVGSVMGRDSHRGAVVPEVGHILCGGHGTTKFSGLFKSLKR